MPLRRTVSGLAAATGLLFSLGACGDADRTAPPPVNSRATSSSTPSATPTAVDPTVAAKAKVLADYKHFMTIWTAGTVSGDPAYPYEQVMAGEALKVTRSASTADRLRGIKLHGSTKFLRGSVVKLDLKVKPTSAEIQSCELDDLSGLDKNGKVAYKPSGQVSAAMTLNLIGDRWKLTGQEITGKDEGACAR